MLYKSNLLTLVTMVDSWYIDEYWFMGPRGRFYSYVYQVMYLGGALRTKETLPDFRECRVGYPTSTSISRVDG